MYGVYMSVYTQHYWWPFSESCRKMEPTEPAGEVKWWGGVGWGGGETGQEEKWGGVEGGGLSDNGTCQILFFLLDSLPPLSLVPVKTPPPSLPICPLTGCTSSLFFCTVSSMCVCMLEKDRTGIFM